MDIKFIEFFKQVKRESAKINWADRDDTLKSALMVLVVIFLASCFFLITDLVIYKIVQFLLELGR